MIELELYNNVCKVKGSDRFVDAKIRDICSYEVPGAKYIPVCKAGLWNGRKSLYDGRAKKFPVGLVSKVIGILKHNDIPYRVVDCRGELPPLGEEITHSITLRDYQQTAIEKCIKATRGVVQAPTGSGKTIIAIGLIAKMGLPALILTDKKDMAIQLRDEIHKFTGKEVGLYQGKNKEFNLFTVATIQSISKEATDKVNNYFKVVIIDEYHHSTASSYLKFLGSLDKIFYRFGFTATNFRNDESGRLLEANTGKVIFEIDKRELIEQGLLLEPTIRILDSTIDDRMVGSLQEETEYAQIYDLCIVKNEERNRLIIDSGNILVNKNFKVLVLVTKIEHGESLSQKTGWEFISGGSGDAKRLLLKNRMKQGDLDILIATSIFDEGIDIPAVSAVIFAGAGRSTLSVVQRIGRILRPKEGKKTAIVVDFSDSFHPMMRAQAVARRAVYLSEGWKIGESNQNIMR